MRSQSALAFVSLLSSAASLLLAATSIVIGRQVDYLDHLPLFNAMAAGMLALVLAALLSGLAGTWKARGRGAWLWSANVVAVFATAFLLFNS